MIHKSLIKIKVKRYYVKSFLYSNIRSLVLLDEYSSTYFIHLSFPSNFNEDDLIGTYIYLTYLWINPDRRFVEFEGLNTIFYFILEKGVFERVNIYPNTYLALQSLWQRIN